jgi:hypothetical protein
MDKIIEPNGKFPFEKLILTTPTFMNSGNYFIKYLMNDSPLYIQPPKCLTKQGIIKGGKKLYCDLLFTNENESFIKWLEDLETYSQKYIYDHRAQWFESNLEMHDIENSFTSSMKIYKSGKYYIIRTIIPTRLGQCTLKIFDESEMEVSMEDIQDLTSVMTIWEVLGIKCSTRSFQIDIEVKQMMTVKPDNLFEKCVFTSTKQHRDEDNHVATDTYSECLEKTPNLPPHVHDEKEEEDEHPSLLENIENIENITAEVEEEEQPKQHDQEDEDEDEEDEEEPFEVIEDNTYNLDVTSSSSPSYELETVELNVQDVQEEENGFQLKTRNDVYYEIYVEAKQKAEEARNLAISAYLEAKRIKELYMIQEPLDIFNKPPTI